VPNNAHRSLRSEEAVALPTFLPSASTAAAKHDVSLLVPVEGRLPRCRLLHVNGARVSVVAVAFVAAFEGREVSGGTDSRGKKGGRDARFENVERVDRGGDGGRCTAFRAGSARRHWLGRREEVRLWLRRFKSLQGRRWEEGNRKRQSVREVSP
jgi:hypothetical protein